jgi:filamentous hemagglutinin
VSTGWNNLSPDVQDAIRGGATVASILIPAGAAGRVGKAMPECCNAPNRTQLIDDLVAGGTRITPENVVDIRSINGRTVWLETGNSNAGLRHIVGEHGPEFAQRGIPEAEIPDVLFAALQRNNVVGYQGRGTGRPIYEFEYGGQTHRLGVTVGDNGFIVGANFR